MSTQTYPCSICRSVQHTTSRCDNRGRITKEIHEECLQRWIAIMEDEDGEIAETLFKETETWLNANRVNLLKSLLSLNLIRNMREARKRIMHIYQYLALKTIEPPSGVTSQELDELMEQLEEEGGFHHYLYLIGQHYVTNGDEDEEEEEEEEEEKIKTPDLVVEHSLEPLVLSECTICYEQGCINTQCGHVYCEPCVRSTIQTYKKSNKPEVECAMCRSEVNAYSCSDEQVYERIKYIIFNL